TAPAPTDDQATRTSSSFKTDSAPEITDGILEPVMSAIAESERPLLLTGRGGVWAGATEAIREIGEKIGAMHASSLLAPSAIQTEWDLGIAGGFNIDSRFELLRQADLVLAFGASLNFYQTRGGELFEGADRVIQVDL